MNMLIYPNYSILIESAPLQVANISTSAKVQIDYRLRYAHRRTDAADSKLPVDPCATRSLLSSIVDSLSSACGPMELCTAGGPKWTYTSLQQSSLQYRRCTLSLRVRLSACLSACLRACVRACLTACLKASLKA